MDLLTVGLIGSALLCSLVAGIVLAFACVIMPGIRRLGDHDFLQSFKAMDRVIQDNQPVFMLVWVGSVLVLVVTAALGLWRLDGVDRILIIAATVIYLVGVQLPTATVNIPLNNQLQAQELGSLSEASLDDARTVFEARWVRWNLIRTVFAVLTSVLLITLAVRLEGLT
jgi:uncharacterized membrane protein